MKEFKGTEALVLSVEDEVGIRIIITELTNSSKNQLPGIRKVKFKKFLKFFVNDDGGCELMLL